MYYNKPRQLILPYLVGLTHCTAPLLPNDPEPVAARVCLPPKVELAPNQRPPSLSELEKMNRRCGQLFGYKKACAIKVVKKANDHTNVVCGEGSK